VPGATRLGGAAHPSAPDAEGADLAMYDGAEPGEVLTAHPHDAEAAPAAYEQAMFPRSAAAAADGAELHDLLFGGAAPHGLIAMSTGHG